MLKFTRTSKVDITKYQHRINYNGQIWVDREAMQNMLDYNRHRSDTMRILARNVMLIDSSNNCVDLSKQSVVTFLTRVMKCPESMFFTKKSENASLDAKDVLKPLLEEGYAEEFLEYYMGFTSLKNRCGRMEGVLLRLFNTGKVDRDGRPLSGLTYTASEQQNLRFNYKDEDLISIPKEYTGSFTVEDGYFLAWGDAAQADLRAMYNLFIRDERNAIIMDNTKDKYEGIARLLHQSLKEAGDNSMAISNEKLAAGEMDDENYKKWMALGFPEQVDFDVEAFKLERDMYKTEVLATTYGRSNGTSKKTGEFASRFRKFLEICPRYQEYRKRLSNAFDLGLVTPFMGYFGYEQMDVPGKYSGAKKDFINKGLNTPIQTATSQIIILVVNEILDRFYALGYTEDDVSVYIVRHDEPIFRLSERAMKDAWILNQAQEIVVDNWTPLEIKFSFGYRYKQEDEQLTSDIHQVFKDNEAKIEVFKPDEAAAPFWPVKKQMVLGLGTQQVGSKTTVAVYSENLSPTGGPTMDYFLIDSIDKEEVKLKIIAQLSSDSASNFVINEDFGGVIVKSPLFSYEGFHNDVYYKFRQASEIISDVAQHAAHIVAAKYAIRENIPFAAREDIISANVNFIKGMESLNVFK